jgi:hypothetical protein
VRSRAEQLAGAKKMRQLAQKARTQERREYLLKLAALGIALARVNPDQGLPPEAERPSTEAGEQHVIPGAERISDAEFARRKAAEALKAEVNQKPADEGLFGDGANQTDLVELAGRPNRVKS